MKVNVLFFGATAAQIGARELDVQVSEPASVANLLDQLVDSYPSLGARKLLIAVNEEYVTETRQLGDGDEVAVFTAVSGG